MFDVLCSYMTDISLVLPDIRSAYNVGSIMRSAEIFSVKHIYFSGYTPYPITKDDSRLPHIANKTHKKIAKTSLGAEIIVPFTVHKSIEEALSAAMADGNKIYALEISPNSVPLNKFKLQSKSAFILGNELDGINLEKIKTLDGIIEIPQFGTKESLNVSAACSILLYDISQKARRC